MFLSHSVEGDCMVQLHSGHRDATKSLPGWRSCLVRQNNQSCRAAVDHPLDGLGSLNILEVAGSLVQCMWPAGILQMWRETNWKRKFSLQWQSDQRLIKY